MTTSNFLNNNYSINDLKLKFDKEILELRSLNLKLDLTRGKPSPQQLDLSNSIEGILNNNFLTSTGIDTRNYGQIDGLLEIKDLFSNILEVPSENILVGGNSSLTLMYQYMSHAYHFGTRGKNTAWSKLTNPSFICPSPGCDRHFAICELLGIKMINVSMTNDGPDMDQVEEIIKNDPSCCGIWCVPKYSNPTGVIYNSDTVQRIARLKNISNPTFRIFWDNAYVLHSFNDNDKLDNIYEIAKVENSEDSILIFSSTSKITFAGSGISFLATSKNNLKHFIEFLSYQTIGPDKVNQLRHLMFLKNTEGIRNHMKLHAQIMQPKFNKVLSVLEKELSPYNFATWSKPNGGYFISLDTLPGLAKETVNLCAEIGVKLTPAGSTYPYGIDPNDTNIRIAPSFANDEDIEIATKCLTSVIGYLSCKKLS